MKHSNILVLLLIALFSISVSAQEHPASTNYVLLKGHFSSAGGYASSSNYNVISSMGQVSPVGYGYSNTYKLYSGLFTPMFSSYNSIPTITNFSAMPQADFSASVFPYTVTFYVTVYDIDSSVFDYTWDFGDGETSQNLNQGATLTVTHQFAAAKTTGPYQVTCTVSDKLASTYETIDIYLGPQAPKVEIVAHPTYGSRPLTVTFSGSATDPDNGTITNYEWDFGDGSSHQSGATLTSTTHTYTQVVTATTIYTATLFVTDNDARVGTATQKISYIPAIFFDDFEDGDASDWTQHQYYDWTVVDNVTKMLRTAAEDTPRHITAPIPGGTMSYGSIRVDMYIPSTSTTEYKTGMIIWAFNSYQDYRYLKVDKTNNKIVFGQRNPSDIDKIEYTPNGWSIPTDQVFNVQLIFQPDGIAVAKIGDVTVGSYDYLEAKNGAVGLATRKSLTYFDNFLVTQSVETNLPPVVTVDPDVYAANMYPATVTFTVTASDPDGDPDLMTYVWKFGDGKTSLEKEPTNIYYSEGTFVSTLYVTDSGVGTYDPATTTKYSYINIGVDFYDNFDDGSVSDWQVLDGSWSVINGELVASTDDLNHKILCPYTATADLNYAMACVKFNIQPKSTNTKQNAIMIIGYQDAGWAYRFVRFDYDTNTIAVMHDDDTTTEITDSSVLQTFTLNTDYFACVKVEDSSSSDKVTVYLDGKQIMTYTYSSHWYGKWGLRSGKSNTKFDDYMIFDPTTSNSNAPDIDTNFKDADFGEVRTDSTTGQTMQLIIYNKAPVPLGDNLNITSLVITNTDFTIEDPSTSLPISSLAAIPAGGSATIQIRYKPSSEGEDTAQLKIYSDDPDEAVYYVNFQGEGVRSLRPTATITISPTSGSGPIPLTVNFSADATDPDGDDNLITYQWNFGDGSAVNTNKVCTHTYLTIGEYTATLTLTDEETQTNQYTTEINASYYYFLDTFSDADITDWTPTTSSRWTTYNDSGDIRLLGTYLSGQENIIAPSAAEFADTGIMEVDAAITSSSDGNVFYMIFDYVDARNYGMIHFQLDSGTWYLKKVVNNFKNLVTYGSYLINRAQMNHFKLEFTSGSITISINDEVLTSGVVYGTFTGSKNGLAVYASKAYFDNYKITFTNMDSINQPPTVDISADPTSGYSPQEVTFTATADDPDGNEAFITYRWNFGDGSGTSTAQNPIYTYTTTGTFTATCTVTDSGIPAMSATDTVVITIVEGNHPPNVTINADQTQGKPPLTVTFTSTVTDDEGNTPYTYLWNFGDGSATSSEANPVHTYTVLGDYTATCSVTDTGVPPRTGTATLDIEISNWLTVFEDIFDDGNYTGWTPSTASYWTMFLVATGNYAVNGASSALSWLLAPTATAEFKEGNSVEFDFYIRSGQSVTGMNLGMIFDYTDSKNYTWIYMKGKVTTAIEIRKVVNGTSTTLTTGTMPVLSYDTWYHFKALLASNTITVTIGSTTAINAYAYGAVTNTTAGLAVYASSVLFDNFIIKRDASLDGNTAPTVTVNASAVEGQAPLTVTFTSTVTDKENDVPFTYLWNFGDGSSTSTDENPVHTYTATGVYTATCSVTDSGDPAQTGSDTITIDVSNWYTLFEDTFNDGNYSGWTPSTTSYWTMYLKGTGDYAANGASSALSWMIAPTATAEFEEGNKVEFDFYIRSGQSVTGMNLGLIFDYTNSTNYTWIYMKGKATTAIEIRRVVNGTSTTLATGTMPVLSYDTWYHFKAVLMSNAITISLNDTVAINAYAYGTVTNTATGLAVYASSVLFDNFIIKRDGSLDGNTAPQVTVAASPNDGQIPLTVTFSSTVTDKENDVPFTYSWNFGDGSSASSEENPIHTYTTTGTYTATLSVTDSGDPTQTGSGTTPVSATNLVTVFSDDFNDGTFSDWTVSSGTWSLYQVATDSYRLLGASVSEGYLLAPATSTFNNGSTLEFDFLFRSGQTLTKKKVGFIFNWISSTTFTLVRLNYELNKVEVVKYTSGDTAKVYSATISAVTTDTWYHIKADFSGNVLNVSLDGTNIVSSYSHGAVTSERTGLWTSESSVFFDNYVMKEQM